MAAAALLVLAALAAPALAQYPALMLHAHPNLGYDTERVRQQLDFLKENGYTTVTPDEFMDWYENAAAPPYRPVLVMFDDNYVRMYTEVFPMMRERGQVCVNFAHTDYVGGGGANEKATWANIIEMENAGVITTESHTKTHRNLPTLTDNEVIVEIRDSKAAIEANAPGKTCRYLAYPYGAHDARSIAACEAYGYRAAWIASGGLNYRTTPRYELERIGMDGIDLETFKTRIGFYSLPAAPGPGWVLDNTDPNFFADAGVWTGSGSVSGYWGANYVTAPPDGSEAVARWGVKLPVEGRMRVWARWTAASNRAPNAVYRVRHAGGEASFTVDQRERGGQWNLLGIFPFTRAQPAEIFLENNTEGYLVADAVWIEPAPPSGAGWIVR